MGTENGNGVHTCGWGIAHENPFHKQPDECVSACGLDGTAIAAPAYHVLTLLRRGGLLGFIYLITQSLDHPHPSEISFGPSDGYSNRVHPIGWFCLVQFPVRH